MQYRRFGRTELQMPVITCGGMRFQHKWDDIPWKEVPREGQANLEEIVEYALQNGINHFETARGYGSSEMQLGAILPRYPRESLIVQTKVAPTPDPKDFLKGFDQSMEYLQLDYVDLLGLHGINNEEVLERALRPGGCLEAAQRLKEQGRVRHIGFSTHARPEVIIEAIESDAFDYVNLHWYFVNELAWPAVEAAARHDMGVFIISPNDKGGKLYEPPERLRELCAPLHPMQFNDLFCWARPQVHTLSMGVSCPEDFDTHLEAVEMIDRAAEIVAPIEQRLRGRMEQELGADWCERWAEGIPDWEQVPGGINVKEIARLWTYAKALDMVEYGKFRYNLMGNGGHWMPGYKAERFDEEALRQALRGSPFVDRLPQIMRESHRMMSGEAVQRLSKSDA